MCPIPCYQYVCDDCDHEWEDYRPMAERAPGPCPACHSRNTSKLIGTPQIIPPCDSGWEYKNGGKGQWIGGLGSRKDPKTYCRSIGEAEEKAKRLGRPYERA